MTPQEKLDNFLKQEGLEISASIISTNPDILSVMRQPVLNLFLQCVKAQWTVKETEPTNTNINDNKETTAP